MVIIFDYLFRTRNHPREYRTTSILKQIISKILHIVTAFNFCLKRNHYQSSPCTFVNSTDLWQVVGIKHKCMTWNIGKRCFVFLLCVNFIRRTKLFYIRGIKSHTFFQLCCNEQSFSLGLGKFWFHISFTPNRQHISGDVTTISSKHTGYHIPEG